MADLYEAPVRVDSNSKPVDHRMSFTLGPNTPTAFLGVADGGSQSIGTNTGPLSQLASFTITGGSGKVTAAWTTQTAADEYYVEYWKSTDPTSRTGLVATGSSVIIPTVSGTVVQAKGQARVKYSRGSWVVGPFSSVASGTGV